MIAALKRDQLSAFTLPRRRRRSWKEFGQSVLASAFSSPNASPLGAFIQSPLLARDAGPGGVATFIIAVGNGNGGAPFSKIMGTNDGVNWINQTHPAVAGPLFSVTFSPTLGSGSGRFVAVGGGAGVGNVLTSDDGGVTWIARACPQHEWRSVIWAPAPQSKFVAVADTEGGQSMTSPDGIVWTINASTPSDSWVCVKYNAPLNNFVAIGQSLPSTMTSSDGVNWNQHPSAFTVPFLGTFQPIGGSDCANIAGGGTDGGVVVCTTNTYIIYSLDGGVTFTSPHSGVIPPFMPTSILNAWFGVCWASGIAPNGEWVAVGGSEPIGGSNPWLQHSEFGTSSWTGDAAPVGTDNTYNWYSVTWSQTLMSYVAVSLNFALNTMIGVSQFPFANIIWTAHNAAPGSGQWECVCASK